jgi:hypothetical protein
MTDEPIRQQSSRRGFGAACLAAMHDWRERQAAREIQYYQHLIHNPRAHTGWLAAGRSGAEPARRPQDAPSSRPDQAKRRERAWPVSLEMTVIVAALVVFAVLHIVVGAMLMQHAARAPGEATAVLHHGD